MCSFRGPGVGGGRPAFHMKSIDVEIDVGPESYCGAAARPRGQPRHLPTAELYPPPPPKRGGSKTRTGHRCARHHCTRRTKRRPLEFYAGGMMQATESGGDASSGAPKPRLIIRQLVTENFKSYAGVQVIGPFHTVRIPPPALVHPRDVVRSSDVGRALSPSPPSSARTAAASQT